jgi:hypothetical protein
MITDQMVVQKSGLVVYKAKAPGSFIDNLMQAFFGAKRSAIKQGVTGQVLSIELEEAIETLNMQNLDKAFMSARGNILKNIASAAGMPASIIMQETLTEGFGEGTEDAKKEAEYLDYIRSDMDPAYAFLDRICQRKGRLAFDIDKLKKHLETKATAEVVQPEEGEEPSKPRPFSAAS